MSVRARATAAPLDDDDATAGHPLREEIEATMRAAADLDEARAACILLINSQFDYARAVPCCCNRLVQRSVPKNVWSGSS